MAAATLRRVYPAYGRELMRRRQAGEHPVGELLLLTLGFWPKVGEGDGEWTPGRALAIFDDQPLGRLELSMLAGLHVLIACDAKRFSRARELAQLVLPSAAGEGHGVGARFRDAPVLSLPARRVGGLHRARARVLDADRQAPCSITRSLNCGASEMTARHERQKTKRCGGRRPGGEGRRAKARPGGRSVQGADGIGQRAARVDAAARDGQARQSDGVAEEHRDRAGERHALAGRDRAGRVRPSRDEAQGAAVPGARAWRVGGSRRHAPAGVDVDRARHQRRSNRTCRMRWRRSPTRIATTSCRST
jgi:hypothetical protein